MTVYVLFNQNSCEIRGVFSTEELAMENKEYGGDIVLSIPIDEVLR